MSPTNKKRRPAHSSSLGSLLQRSLLLAFAGGFASGGLTRADEECALSTAAQWQQATAHSDGVDVGEHGLALRQAPKGQWTSRWLDAPSGEFWKSLTADCDIDLFANKTIEVVVDGSEKPFVDADGVEHDWYGRCMIAIVDANRWIMAIRSGVNHIRWGDRDAIHLLTSSDEGRTWGKLNQWFDGTAIEGLPYEDGHTHSEPGLYRMPNGDLVLQFWRTSFTSGTKQLRSTDDGKTWQVDHDRLEVLGVPEVPGNLAIGTEDWFIDPENPEDVYMAFQFWDHQGKLGKHLSGTFLALSQDNGKSYRFLSWMGPLGDIRDPHGKATFEPAIEYVGNRTIVAVLRDAHFGGHAYTWQTESIDMGRSFSPIVDISDKIDGGIPRGMWQRARIYKESNPVFQFGNGLDYAKGEGRLWGFGLHSNGGGYTRKPVVYYSDDNGQTWHGPESLHGAMTPGTDTGYGDMKRRTDGTFVAATYFATPDSSVADTEQYTFGGQRVRMRVEVDRNGDGEPDADSTWQEIYGGRNAIGLAEVSGPRWRVRLELSAPPGAPLPAVRAVRLQTEPREGATVHAANVQRPKVLLHWQAQPPVEQDGQRRVPDAGPDGRDARLLGDVRYMADPPRFELDGKAALVAPEPVEPARLTVEALFRADRLEGELQHIVSVFDPWEDRDERNPRQWTLEIHEGRLRFGIFGEDQRWHFAGSNLPLTPGWHHAVGTFDGRQLRVYMNGMLQRRFPGPASGRFQGRVNRPRAGAAKPPSAGSSAPLGHYGFEGAVASVRLLDQALPAEQVRAAYRAACQRVPAVAEQALPTAPARPKAPFKVLFSNDTTNTTTCTSPYSKREEPFRPEMIDATIDEAQGVDVHMLQPGFGWAPLWKSKAYPDHYSWWTKERGQIASGYAKYMLEGGDLVERFIRHCRQKDVVPFISLRLNDGHGKEWVDAPPGSKLPVWAVLTQSRFYSEHPEYQIGSGHGWDATVQNWAIPEVREYKFAFIEELCENYDLDGFELDFMRHTSYFDTRKTSAAERVRIMTGFVGRVRQLLDRTARSGRRRWLCVRVPCLVREHERLGIDLPAMVAAGVDMVNLSPYFFMQQLHDLPLVREMVPDAAVYLEMTHATAPMPIDAMGGGYDQFGYRRATDEQYYTTAHTAYARGGDGVSLFNFVYFREHGPPYVDPAPRGPFNEPPFHVLERLGQPEWLARQPQWYFMGKQWRGSFDGRFSAGQTRAYTIDMAPTEHQTAEGILRLMVGNPVPGHRWTVRVNGAPLRPIACRGKMLGHPYEAGLGKPEQYACFALPRAGVHDGPNRIEATLEAGPAAEVVFIDAVLP